MKIRCPVCSHVFSSRDVYCEDRKDPEKSLGCPACKTFFLRKEKTGGLRRQIAFGFMGGGIAAPASMMVGHTVSGGEAIYAVYGGTILISWLVSMSLLGLDYTNEQSDLIPVTKPVNEAPD